MDNIERMLELLPEDLEEIAKETGALRRKREIKTAADLMRLVFLYVVQGLSYLEVSVVAKMRGFAKISDVGFMKRFGRCDGLIERLLGEFSSGATAHYKKPAVFEKYDIKGLDASVVVSGGKARIVHRLHYAIDIFKLKSDQYKITSEKTGESLTNFEVSPGDIYIGDRAYGTKTSMEHCYAGGGDFVFRVRRGAFDIYGGDGGKIDLVDMLGRIEGDGTLDLECYFINSGNEYESVRICAMLKPKDIVESPDDDTAFMNNYIVVVTSMLDRDIGAGDILDLYRLRWQVELYFKRLKSLMGFGDVPNKTEKNVRTWLNAKLAVAILLESMVAGVDFSPSGL